MSHASRDFPFEDGLEQACWLQAACQTSANSVKLAVEQSLHDPAMSDPTAGESPPEVASTSTAAEDSVIAVRVRTLSQDTHEVSVPAAVSLYLLFGTYEVARSRQCFNTY